MALLDIIVDGILGDFTAIYNCYYASDYNSSGAPESDLAHPMSLSAMKSNDMASKLGKNFFFYDTSWDNYTSSASTQFIKFNWEKVSGWTNGESCGTKTFGVLDWTAPATKVTVLAYEDWGNLDGVPTRLELYYKDNLYKTILNPPRRVEIDVYGSFVSSSWDKVEAKWYTKNGLAITNTDYISQAKACFIKGTKILTTNGLISIEDIKVGDLVLSENENGDIEEQKVYHTYNHNPRSCIRDKIRQWREYDCYLVTSNLCKRSWRSTSSIIENWRYFSRQR